MTIFRVPQCYCQWHAHTCRVGKALEESRLSGAPTTLSGTPGTTRTQRGWGQVSRPGILRAPRFTCTGRGGAEEKESVSGERRVPRGERGPRPVRLHPRGQPPPGRDFLLGGRRAGRGGAGRGGRRPRRAGPRAAPMRFGAGPRLFPVPAPRSAAEEAGGRGGGGGAARAKEEPSLPSWRPAGPWWPAPAAAARRRGRLGAASWPCCSLSPRRSGCRRRSWVSGARPAGGALGLEGTARGRRSGSQPAPCGVRLSLADGGSSVK